MTKAGLGTWQRCSKQWGNRLPTASTGHGRGYALFPWAWLCRLFPISAQQPRNNLTPSYPHRYRARGGGFLPYVLAGLRVNNLSRSHERVLI